jgi:hypothetical protein
MTRRKCEREPLIVAAAHSGVWPAGLEDHVAACPDCADTNQIAQLFLEHAAAASAQSDPPAANIVWHRIQAQRQQLALRRATQCMTLMRILAALYAVVLAAWYLPRLWHMPPGQLFTALSPLSGGMVFAGVVTAVVAVALGSCCLVLLGSRTIFPLRT